MENISTDTIAAIATARGQAALAIVRLSGAEAIDMVASAFRGKDLRTVPSHTAHVGYFLNASGEAIDQVVVTVFKGPHSATGEDVVEISCHGGALAPQLILRALLERGARLAEPGEFTQRAFINGKLDLVQAEAVADLIHARSTLAHRVSLNQLQGRYSEIIQRVREDLLHVAALVELELDFVEEDVEFADRDELRGLLKRIDSTVTRLLATYQLNTMLRDGVRVVIGGRPNAGKSTLLNALVERDRAIVSEIPGTTRDEIEAEVEWEGILFQFVDTAGLRETSDIIEAEGVRRTYRTIEHSDILLYVYDLRVGLDDEEKAFLRRVQSQRVVIVVGNKRDLASTCTLPSEELATSALALSAKRAWEHPEELTPLRELLVRYVREQFSAVETSAVVVNQRHRQHLQKAQQAIRRAFEGLNSGLTGDLLALDLREALHELGAITGEITTEDVLGQIFSQFCIGK